MNGDYVGPDRRKIKKGERDVRGLLAMMCVVGSFGLSFMSLAVAIYRNVALGDGITPASLAEIPAWTAGIVGTVVGYYFGSRGAAGIETAAIVQAQQGVTLDEVHRLTNSARTEMVEKIDELTTALTQSQADVAEGRRELVAAEKKK